MEFELAMQWENRYGIDTFHVLVYRDENGDFRVKGGSGKSKALRRWISDVTTVDEEYADNYYYRCNVARSLYDLMNGTYQIFVWNAGKRDKMREQIARRAFQNAVNDILYVYNN